MKKIIVILCLMLLSSQGYCADYVHIDNKNDIRALPDKWTFANGNKTGNFKLMPSSILIAEGWREITVKNNESYDTAIQVRTLESVNIVIFANHCEITYTVTNKGLNPYKKEKGREIRAEGMAILNAKYSDPMDDGYDTDFATLKAYYKNTIIPLVTNASTLAQVRNINNGDEYTWPSI